MTQKLRGDEKGAEEVATPRNSPSSSIHLETETTPPPHTHSLSAGHRQCVKCEEDVEFVREI